MVMEVKKMADSSPTPKEPKHLHYIKCTLCGEICKRAVLITCCNAPCCSNCGIKKITLDRKCWNCETPGLKTEDLKNDDVIREAVEHYKNNGEIHSYMGIYELQERDFFMQERELLKPKVELLTVDVLALINCSICGEICWRAVTVSCCEASCCRPCGTKKITSERKCWIQQCGAAGIETSDLENDILLRQAVDYYKENGKMDPTHVDLLKQRNKRKIDLALMNCSVCAEITPEEDSRSNSGSDITKPSKWEGVAKTKKMDDIGKHDYYRKNSHESRETIQSKLNEEDRISSHEYEETTESRWDGIAELRDDRDGYHQNYKYLGVGVSRDETLKGSIDRYLSYEPDREKTLFEWRETSTYFDTYNIRDRPCHKPGMLAKSDITTERDYEQEFPAIFKDEKMVEVGNGSTVPEATILKPREETKKSELPAPRKVTGNERSIEPPVSVMEKPLPKMLTSVKLIDDNYTFCDNITDFLSDNNDFLVIGVLGLQNSGKSTIINALAKITPEDDDVFPVQTYEHQMFGQHCTNGIDVLINSHRTIFLDCQPLLSSSIMDQTIQLESKSEFSITETTMEINSLRMMGFLFSICHTVLLVQDWFVDINLIRLIAAAEMLKPVASDIREHFPHLVIVHNKGTGLEQDLRQDMEGFYRRVFAKSMLQWKDKQDKPILQVMSDYSDETITPPNISSHPSFEDAVKMLRKKVYSLKRTPLCQNRLDEKSWMNLARKTWENIKNSSFYVEYSRLLP